MSYRVSRRALLAGAGALALAPRALACGWDKDTLRDEIQKAPTTFDLVVAQLPTHSDAWYLRTVEQSKATLAAHPDDPPATDDLSMALAHLGRYDEADVVLSRAIGLHPDRYETLSNLGVLRKKQGRLDEAARYISAALERKPEGHLGVGDWYLRNLRWRARTKPQSSFVNVPYGEILPDAASVEEPGDVYASWQLKSHVALGAAKRAGLAYEGQVGLFGGPPELGQPLAAHYERDYERLQQLLRYDRKFTDGLLVLGDELASRHDFGLALIAWLRALSLGHPRGDVIRQRVELVQRHWRATSTHNPLDLAAAQALTDRALAQATAWVETFQREEAAAVAAGGNPTFEEVEVALEARGVTRWRAPELPSAG